VIYLLFGLLLWWALDQYIDPSEAEQASTAKKDLFQAWGFIMAGVAGVVGIYFTWQNLRQTQESTQDTLRLTAQGQNTDRFTRAIEQLGATDDKKTTPKLEIRLGGIYALAQIASDSSEEYHWPVTAVLAAYIRQHAPRKEEGLRSKEDRPHLSRRLPDVQTILNVLGRRARYYGHGERIRIDLGYTGLWGAHVNPGAHFEGVYFDGAILENVSLAEAQLEGASFEKAKLNGANLEGANLREANFKEADLSDADLSGADLTNANVTKEQLDMVRSLEGTIMPDGLTHH